MDYSYQGSKHPQAGLILAQEILKIIRICLLFWNLVISKTNNMRMN